MKKNDEAKNTEIKEKKQMSKTKKIVLSVISAFVAVLLVVLLIVALTNWGNIRAVFKWLTSSKEQIEQDLQKGKEQQVTALQDAGMTASTEMLESLSKGEITEVQFQQILLGNLTLEQAIALNNSAKVEEIPVVNTEQKFIDAIDAYEKGEISDSQLLQISKEELTLEQAVKDNEQNIPEDEQELSKEETPSQKDEKEPDESEETSDVKDTPVAEKDKPVKQDNDKESDKAPQSSEETTKAPVDTQTSQPYDKDDEPVKPQKPETTQKPEKNSSDADKEVTKPSTPSTNDTKKEENKKDPPKNTSTGFTKETLEAYKKGEISDSQFAEIGSNNMTLDEAKEENKNSVNKKPPATSTDASGDKKPTSQPEKPSQTQPKSSDNANESASKDKVDKDNTSSSNKEEKPSSSKPNDQTTESTKPSGTTGGSVDEKIASLITKMYVLKAQYEGSVAGVVESMKAQYSALPASQRTSSAKSSIAASYMGQINAMEAQCDAQVNAIVSELRQLLKANGRDTSLADSILSTYASEKESTKAYYMSRYGG